jgi:hypothetical protein
MSHGMVLKLTTERFKHSSGLMMTNAESFPYRCRCGQQWQSARLLVQHLTDSREQEQCETQAS